MSSLSSVLLHENPLLYLDCLGGNTRMLFEAFFALRDYRGAILKAGQDQVSDYTGITGPSLNQMAQAVIKNLRIKMQVASDLPELPNDKRIIVIANHPPLALMFPTFDVVTQAQGISELRCLVKQEARDQKRYLPWLFARPAAHAGHIILLTRNDKEEDIRRIQRGCESHFSPGSALFCFVDASRPHPDKIRASAEKFKEHYNHSIDPDQLFVNFPRYGGIHGILQALKKYDPDSEPVIFNMTVGSNQDHLYRSTFHVDGEILTRTDLLGASNELEAQAAHLRTRLFKLWLEKNNKIKRWRQEAVRGHSFVDALAFLGIDLMAFGN